MRGSVELISADALRGHVESLTRLGPRHEDNPAAVTAALAYVTASLSASGYQVEREPYGEAPHEVNLIAVLPGAEEPILEVGAHWDTVAQSPGADDNASGVAGLLEIARALADADGSGRPVRYCVFGGEEGQEDALAGSRAHVAGLSRAPGRVEGAVVLEMIGYRDRRPGTQRIPADIAAVAGDLGPIADHGDFVAVIGNPAAGDYLAAFRAAAAQTPSPLPVLPLTLPAGVTTNGVRSDHYPYWLSGRKAVQVTDTAEFRNPHYHQTTDTPKTLDYDFAAAVATVVAAAVRALTPQGQG